MAVDEFLSTYRNSMLNRKMINPLAVSSTSVAKAPQFGIKPSKRAPASSPGFGATIPDWLGARQSGAIDRYIQSKTKSTSEIAANYASKAAGQIPTNEFGVVEDKLTDFNPAFTSQLTSINDRGKASLATEEAKSQWGFLQDQAEMNAGFQVNWAPGASSKNVGAKAVAMAMTAAQNGVPYVWGGNSLTKGVDCSGLVQQIYGKLGISLPRTTYQQAKAGKHVLGGMSSWLPGDLVFFNTGSRDPNGIGTFGHVGIYIGNGKMIEAPGRGKTVRISSVGNPSRVVRPW